MELDGRTTDLPAMIVGINGSGFSHNVTDEFLEQLHRQVIGNLTKDYENIHDLMKRPLWRGIILAIYVSIIVIGLIGNSVVVFIVARNKNMQNITNIFIANLALSDIGLCIFSLPVQLHYQMTEKLLFGDFMCKVIFAAFAVPMYVSNFTILLIAFDRYWLIVFPLKERMNFRHALLYILVSIIVSIILGIPVMVYSVPTHVSEPEIGLHRTYCLEYWPDETSRLVYTILMFVFQFCLPLILTALLYYRIYRRLQDRPSQRAQTERKQKTNKILVAIVSLFVVCWLPWNLFSILAEIDSDIVYGTHFKFLDLLLKAFAMGSACINPFLYCWLNDNFRKELDNMAIKMHILNESSHHGSQQPSCMPRGPKTNGENCSTLTEQFGTTVDKTSVVQMTMGRNTSGYYPTEVGFNEEDSQLIMSKPTPVTEL